MSNVGRVYLNFCCGDYVGVELVTYCHFEGCTPLKYDIVSACQPVREKSLDFLHRIVPRVKNIAECQVGSGNNIKNSVPCLLFFGRTQN